ncbi:MAG: hypothetical protein ABI763_01065 [Bacteroidota bacterium]
MPDKNDKNDNAEVNPYSMSIPLEEKNEILPAKANDGKTPEQIFEENKVWIKQHKKRMKEFNKNFAKYYAEVQEEIKQEDLSRQNNV